LIVFAPYFLWWKAGVTDLEGGFLSPILQIRTQSRSRSSSLGADVGVSMPKVYS